MTALRLVSAVVLASCSAPAPRAAAPAPAPPSSCELSRYAPTASVPGPVPSLPPPRVTREPVRADDAFTVWGAAYYLRSVVHRAEVTSGTIAVTGYIVRTNLPDAPVCAVHRSGKADPENCFAPIPTFWVGDRPNAPLEDCIRVLGFASNFAQLHDALLQYGSGKSGPPYIDTFWGVELPNPLPAAGARVTVSGQYGTVFAKSSSGAVRDDVMGLLTYGALETREPASVAATLPGMKLKR